MIATGGSAVYSSDAMELLAKGGPVIYLEVSLDELAERLGDLEERGVVMLGDVRTLPALFDERRPLYERHATATVSIDALTIPEAAQRVRDSIAPALPADV